jgi:mannose-1-phosphate guanylyltransferase
MMAASLALSAVVLAGGSGRRLANVTGGVPKQFCGFGSGRSLLGDTIDRLAPIVAPVRTTVVVDCAHRSYVAGTACLDDVRVLYQPCDRGTAAGVLLGLLPALGSGRDPIVLLTPSDHGVTDRGGFQRSIRNALSWVAHGRHQPVLFGSEPCHPDGDYGWIRPHPGPANSTDYGLRPVATFVEKPPSEVAAAMFAEGAVWNTMVVIARASVLLGLYRRHLPDLTRVLTQAVRLHGLAQDAFLERHYTELPTADFCRDVIAPTRGLWLCTWPAALGWSDLGTPERLRRWMATANYTEWTAPGRAGTVVTMDTGGRVMRRTRAHHNQNQKEQRDDIAASTPSRDEVARRAYELYVQHGCTNGRDLDDWLQAERELHQPPQGTRTEAGDSRDSSERP